MSELDLSGDKAAELLDGMLRVGDVAEVGSDGRVRVTFPDRDNVSSSPLQVLQRWRGSTDMPALGEPVLCLMLPPEQTDGFVVGTVYDAKAPPPAGPAVRVIAGEELRLGSAAADHPAPLGDHLAKLLQGLFDLLKTAVVPTPTGLAPLSGDTTGANAYGTGGILAVVAAMEAAADGLAGLNSEKIKLE